MQTHQTPSSKVDPQIEKITGEWKTLLVDVLCQVNDPKKFATILGQIGAIILQPWSSILDKTLFDKQSSYDLTHKYLNATLDLLEPLEEKHPEVKPALKKAALALGHLFDFGNEKDLIDVNNEEDIRNRFEATVRILIKTDITVSKESITDLTNIFKLLTHETGYDFELMSALPNNDKNNAVRGKIYLSSEGQYVFHNTIGIVEGIFDKNWIKGNLADQLKDEHFLKQILAVISKAGYPLVTSEACLMKRINLVNQCKDDKRLDSKECVPMSDEYEYRFVYGNALFYIGETYFLKKQKEIAILYLKLAEKFASKQLEAFPNSKDFITIFKAASLKLLALGQKKVVWFAQVDRAAAPSGDSSKDKKAGPSP